LWPGTTVSGELRLVMIENVDGTITITSEEVFAAAGLNEHLLELGVRVKALRADPDCDSTVAEVDWGDLYPRIVLQDHPAPGVTIQPDAIPLDHTLVLAAERTSRPGLQPPIVVRTIVVRGSAPDCVGAFLRPPSPLQGFNSSAREVVPKAREEAFELGHLNVGPEHILLALLRGDDAIAAQALNSLHVKSEQIRERIAQSVPPAAPLAQHSSALAAPFTPQATEALGRARSEASALGDASVEPAHILLGLISDRESPVAAMLREISVDPEHARSIVLRLLNRGEHKGNSTRS
jgi:Clp amino terminal domain, pathogenicity island component